MDKVAAIETVTNTFRESIAEMKACTNNDYILAWVDIGLGVGFTKDGKTFATTLVKAETIVPEVNNMPEEAWAFTPIVKNGHNQQASIVKRQFVIKKEIARLEQFIAEILAEAA